MQKYKMTTTGLDLLFSITRINIFLWIYLQSGKLSNFRFEQDWAIENQFTPSVVMKLDAEGRCISTLSFEESNLKKRNY